MTTLYFNDMLKLFSVTNKLTKIIAYHWCEYPEDLTTHKL